MKQTPDRKSATTNASTPRWQSRLENLARPYAVSRLLYALAFLLMLFLMGWILFYWFIKATEEISSQRRTTNDSYTEMHDYFERHELWLSLVVNNTRSSHPDPSFGVGQKNWAIRLPTSSDYIFLTEKDRAQLNSWSANLLYLDSRNRTAVTLHHAPSTVQHPLPAKLWNSLNTPIKFNHKNSAHIRWFLQPDAPQSSVYVFIPMDPANKNNQQWLGLELPRDLLLSTLRENQQRCCSGYVLQGPSGEKLLGSQLSEAQTEAIKAPNGVKTLRTSNFDSHLTLKLPVNISDWTVAYYVDLYPVMRKNLRTEIAAGLLIQVIASLLLFMTVRLVDRRILNPAQRQNERIVESEAFSRTIIDTAPVGICIISQEDATIVLENQLTRLLLADLSLTETITHRPELLHIYREELGDADSYELALSGDNIRHVLVAFASTRYQGEPVLLCTLSDISARKQTEAALASAKRASDAANEAKSAFLATMSHEIRTPLYGVLGTLELLGMTELDAEQRQHLETMQASSGTLLQLINDVLDLSKIEAGQMTIEHTDFDPIVLIETIVRIYSPVAQRKHIDLYCCLDSRLPLQLHGDPLRLQQILGNLLSNAVKFTEAGKVLVRMDLGNITNSHASIVLQVSDSGLGIATEDLKRLFEPFTQVGKLTSQRFGGTGLGLSICRRLTELMGGTINVVSEPGLGTSFTVNIPLLLSKAEPPNPLPMLANQPVYLHSNIHEVREALQGWIERCGGQPIPLARLAELRTLTLIPGSVLVQIGTPLERHLPQALAGCVHVSLTHTSEPQDKDNGHVIHISAYHLRDLLKAIMRLQGHTMTSRILPHELTPSMPNHPQHRLRILVAEDHPINQMLLKSQLEMLGATVTVAQDGEEALRLWQEEKDSFDLVLTDVNMPRVDGYELSRQLRALGSTVPIVGVTANVLREEIERCYEAGMTSHLGKPVSLEALERALQEVERQKQSGPEQGTSL